jgi:transcriptional regulator with XRE-family HTH domain
LRTARYARNLTQQDLAGAAFSKSYISAVERNQMTPSISALRFLAERLAVPLAYLLGEYETPLHTSEAEALEQQLQEVEELLYQGHPAAALERLGPRTANSALRQQNPARWDWLLGWALLQQHQKAEALELMEQRLQEDETRQSPCALGHFAFTLATAKADEHGAVAENQFQTALRCASEIDDPRLLCRIEEQYGALLAAQGRYRDAYLHQRAAVVAAGRLRSAASIKMEAEGSVL